MIRILFICYGNSLKCPQCKQLLRLKRGCGEKQITCAKCGHQFQQKA